MAKVISASDAYALYLVQSACTSTNEDLIAKVVDRISDPEVVQMAADARVKNLRKAGVSDGRVGSVAKKYEKAVLLKQEEWRNFTRKEAKRKKQEKEQERMHELAWKCIKFVDGNPPGSKIVDKGSHPFSQWLSTAYKNKGFSIEFKYQESPYSNGFQRVKVKVGPKVVFEVEGPAFGTRGQKVKTYIPGDWEKKIKATKGSKRGT